MLANTVLTPIQELAPGQVSAIRNGVIDAVVKKASKELSLPENKLVVRDIRAYDDLGFGNNTDYSATATITNVWGTFVSGTTTYVLSAASTGYVDAIADNKTMGDDRYVVLFGVRDWRICRPTTIDYQVGLVKFEIGNADKAIWDVTKCEAYKNYIAGITSSAIVIPPNAPYQIQCFLIASGVALHLQLMGVVVEPVGLVITP